MRPAGGASLRYAAGNVPDAPAALPGFLREELAKLQAALDALADGHIDVTTAAPPKPRDGMLRRADGLGWNPGSGAGVYCFYANAWHFLG